MSRMIIVLVAAVTFSLPVASIPTVHAQQGYQQVMGNTPVYYRRPGLQNRWHLLGTFSRPFARIMAEQLRGQGFQARVGPINY